MMSSTSSGDGHMDMGYDDFDDFGGGPMDMDYGGYDDGGDYY